MHTVWGLLIRELIEDLRKDVQYCVMFRNVPKREIARRANVHITTLHAFLRGDAAHNPTVKTLYALAQAVQEGE